MTASQATWRPRYDEVTTEGGMVTAADPQVAAAGGRILEQGGNAVDAAVAAALADGVVQPSMAGLGGSTLMAIALRDPERLVAVDGGMVSPSGARPEVYPLADDDAAGLASFYGWPAVVDDANIVGARSVAVPGSAPALVAAHERFGRLPLADVVRPAVELADAGVEVNWFFASVIASEAEHLRHDEGCAAAFLRDGLPLRGPGMLPADRLVQPALACTLDRLGAEGAEAFRSGAPARAVVGILASQGGLLTLDDLAGAEPRIGPAEEASVGEHVLAGVPATGFPSVVEALNLVQALEATEPETPDVVRWARALSMALVDRSRYGSTDPDRPTPWAGLMGPAYAQERMRRAAAGEEPPQPPDAAASGTGSDGPSGVTGGGYTSHVTAVDRSGNMVSVTQTLLNEFGARILDPESGIVLNDGMAYFDPRPGSPNSVGPGRWALSAMTPVVLCDRSGPAAAFGASGGPRIISGVAQMAAALAGGASMQEACEEPRLHAGRSRVALDARWPDEAAGQLEAAGFGVVILEEGPTTVNFARPNGIAVDGAGIRRSGLDPAKPAGVAVA